MLAYEATKAVWSLGPLAEGVGFAAGAAKYPAHMNDTLDNKNVGLARRFFQNDAPARVKTMSLVHESYDPQVGPTTTATVEAWGEATLSENLYIWVDPKAYGTLHNVGGVSQDFSPGIPGH